MAKSAASVLPAVPLPATANCTLPTTGRPMRVTVKVNAVLAGGFEAELPSALFALVALTGVIEKLVSSLLIVPAADAVPRIAFVGFESVMTKPSFASPIASPVTLMVMSFVASVAAKATVPVGSVPPKSAALAVPLTV